jgi:hypothetical protein
MGLEVALPLLASGVLAAGGAVVNSKEQGRSQAAQARATSYAMQQEMDRQKQYQDQAQAALKQTVGNFAPEQQAQKQAQETGQRTQAAEQAIDSSPAIATGTPLTGAQNSVIGSDIARSMSNAAAKGKQFASNLGALSGYSGMGVNDNLALAAGQRELSPILGNSQLTGSLYPGRLQSAVNGAKKPSTGLGDLLGAAGMLAAYGAGRGKLF